GVKMPSLKTEKGVSNCGGRIVRRMSGRFCGNATNLRAPFAKGIVISSSAARRRGTKKPVAPAIAVNRKKRRRLKDSLRASRRNDMRKIYQPRATRERHQ